MRLHLRIGGSLIEADDIERHEATQIAAWQTKTARAQELLGDFATSIGILASPGFAIMSAAAIGIVESVVTNSNQKKGLKLLSEAAHDLETLRSSGEWIPISDISPPPFAEPLVWRCILEIDGEINLQQMTFLERAAFISKHKTPEEQIRAGMSRARREVEFAVLPGEFIRVRKGGTSLNVRWASVDEFHLG